MTTDQKLNSLNTLLECCEDLAKAVMALLNRTDLKDSAAVMQKTLCKLQAAREEINK